MEAALHDDTLLARLGGDRKLQRKVIQMFLSDYRETLRRLRQALAAGDRDTLYSAAHSLKASAAILGSAEAMVAAQLIERCCRAGSLDAAARPVNQLAIATEDLAQTFRTDTGWDSD